MDILGRYYTNKIVSTLLVNNIDFKNPKKILDLGIGDASLTIAAYTKWADAKYFATEIEKSKATNIEKELSYLKIYNYDTLKANASKKLEIKFGSIDIAICNPPYLKVDNAKIYANLFKSIGCKDFINLRRITSEIVFFAHNLKLLKKDGELGIIVSDSLITGKDFEIFRKTILEKFNVRRVIQLPDKIFNKTEARTHIVFISKSKSNKDTCELFLSSIDGNLSNKIEIKKVDLIARMDYQFHMAFSNLSSSLNTLKDIGAKIKRGKFTFKDLRAGNQSFFHSIHFNKNNTFLSFDNHVANENILYSANEGDILMCRVGKRIVGKSAFITKGSVLISDCIYKISVPKEYQKIVIDSLTSINGMKWLKAYAHGVCSQVISKTDLEKFPLFNEN